MVAPATADLLAKMALGLADELASTVLLASTTPILVAPAMNTNMWSHPATQANIKILQERGVLQVGPGEGELACGDTGPGRMAEPHEIMDAISTFFSRPGPLTGRRAVVTSGPTHEPLDPVRFIGNRSSGKQGHAIAVALAALGADTTLVTGPTAEPSPEHVSVIRVETAREMLAAVQGALPADIAVCAAAVADWRPRDEVDEKIKKSAAGPPTIDLVENPDILASLACHEAQRPTLVVGFAAETSSTLEYAAAKRRRKGCDWIVANDVSEGSGVFGGDHNQVYLVTPSGTESWPRMTKVDVATQARRRRSRITSGKAASPPSRPFFSWQLSDGIGFPAPSSNCHEKKGLAEEPLLASLRTLVRLQDPFADTDD